MAEPIAVLALRRKRDQISGTIAHYERLIRGAQNDLAHVNSALRLFEATGEAGDAVPDWAALEIGVMLRERRVWIDEILGDRQ